MYFFKEKGKRIWFELYFIVFFFEFGNIYMFI